MPFDPLNRGVLFPNDKKGNPARPDFTGVANVDGVDYRMALWLKLNDKKEIERMSLNFQLKDAQRPAPSKPAAKPAAEPFVDDELPPF